MVLHVYWNPALVSVAGLVLLFVLIKTLVELIPL